MKAQIAIEAFKHVLIWSTAISVTKVKADVEEDEPEEHEVEDLTSIPMGFHR